MDPSEQSALPELPVSPDSIDRLHLRATNVLLRRLQPRVDGGASATCEGRIGGAPIDTSRLAELHDFVGSSSPRA